MKINNIDHVSINVNDIKKPLGFYSRILGLKQQQTVDCCEFDITYFDLPGGSRLELFDYQGKNSNTPREESEVGLRHIAFQVEDVAAHEKHLEPKVWRLPFQQVICQILERVCCCSSIRTA